MDTTLPPPAALGQDVDAPVTPEGVEPLVSLNRLNERALTFIRDRPVTCLVGALALGFVVGKIASRY
mgnify:CR=1 FL=1